MNNSGGNDYDSISIEYGRTQISYVVCEKSKSKLFTLNSFRLISKIFLQIQRKRNFADAKNVLKT